MEFQDLNCMRLVPLLIMDPFAHPYFTDLLYVNVRDAHRVTYREASTYNQNTHPGPKAATPSEGGSLKWKVLRDCFNIVVWDSLINPNCEGIEGMTHCLTDILMSVQMWSPLLRLLAVTLKYTMGNT